MKSIHLRDLPSFLRTTNQDDIMLNFLLQQMKRSRETSAIITNTYEPLEPDVLNSLSSILLSIYTIGLLPLLANQIEDQSFRALGSNLWAEEPECVEWLNSKEPNSIVYVNFGCVMVMTAEQLIEFAWGLAHRRKSFM